MQTKTKKELKSIASKWDWDNLDHNWTILEGAFCRLNWVLDGQKLDDESKDIIQDTLDIIEALQKEVKI